MSRANREKWLDRIVAEVSLAGCSIEQIIPGSTSYRVRMPDGKALDRIFTNKRFAAIAARDMLRRGHTSQGMTSAEWQKSFISEFKETPTGRLKQNVAQAWSKHMEQSLIGKMISGDFTDIETRAVAALPALAAPYGRTSKSS